MTSYSLLCLLPLLTSVVALPAADLLDHVHPRHEELDLVHPSHEQDAVAPKAPQAADKTASNGENLSVKERATECALFLCIRLLKLNFHLICKKKHESDLKKKHRKWFVHVAGMDLPLTPLIHGWSTTRMPGKGTEKQQLQPEKSNPFCCDLLHASFVESHVCITDLHMWGQTMKASPATLTRESTQGKPCSTISTSTTRVFSTTAFGWWTTSRLASWKPKAKFLSTTQKTTTVLKCTFLVQNYLRKSDVFFQDTADYWYIWEGGEWQYNTNIYLETC